MIGPPRRRADLPRVQVPSERDRYEAERRIAIAEAKIGQTVRVMRPVNFADRRYVPAYEVFVVTPEMKRST